jgi:hypothetical protein
MMVRIRNIEIEERIELIKVQNNEQNIVKENKDSTGAVRNFLNSLKLESGFKMLSPSNLVPPKD